MRFCEGVSARPRTVLDIEVLSEGLMSLYPRRWWSLEPTVKGSCRITSVGSISQGGLYSNPSETKSLLCFLRARVICPHIDISGAWGRMLPKLQQLLEPDVVMGVARASWFC